MDNISHINRRLLGAVIMLAILAVAQAIVILAARHPRRHTEPDGVAGMILHRVQSWALPADPVFPTTLVGAERIRQESPEDIQRLHDEINRVFENALGRVNRPGLTAHATSPTLPSAVRTRSDHPLVADLRQLQEQIDRLFASSWECPDWAGMLDPFEAHWDMFQASPAMGLTESPTNYVLTIPLPGIDKSALHVSLVGRVLTISATQSLAVPAGARWGDGGASPERFETRILFPGPVVSDAAQAFIDAEGLLRVEVPKAEDEEPLARSIEVI